MSKESRVEADKEPDSTAKATVLVDKRKEHLETVELVTHYDFRTLFGIKTYNKCGSFLSEGMTDLVHEYGYWVSYPSGDVTIKNAHSDFINACAISDDGRYLYTGSRDTKIAVWDMSIKLNEKVLEWEAHRGWVDCLRYQRGLLISGSQYSNVRIWNALSGQLVCSLDGHTELIWNVDINEDGDRIISCGDDFTIREWSVKTGVCLKVFYGHRHSVVTVLYLKSQDPTSFLSASKDGSIREWNTEDGTMIRSVSDPFPERLTHITFNCDASLLACFCFNSSITVVKWPDCTVVKLIPIHTFRGCFHPSLPQVLVATDLRTNDIAVFDVSNGECIRLLKGHTNQVRNVLFTADGLRLVSVARDKSVRMWDVSNIESE